MTIVIPSVFSDHYMSCPTPECSKFIVKMLICSGRENTMHKGLPFHHSLMFTLHPHLAAGSQPYGHTVISDGTWVSKVCIWHVLSTSFCVNASHSIPAVIFVLPPVWRPSPPDLNHTATPSLAMAHGCSRYVNKILYPLCFVLTHSVQLLQSSLYFSPIWQPYPPDLSHMVTLSF
jgi:hypothetical protein